MGLAVANVKLPPGLRFHPTDVELVMYYLMRKVSGQPLEAGFVAEADIYQFHPADLRELACFSKELNWYFFCSTGIKYGSGQRKNRSTHCGYWKPTGNDRAVIHQEKTVGKVKTLVFHEGKPKKGKRTDWVMYEYRLEDGDKGQSVADVICKIFKKDGLGPRNGEKFGAPYDDDELEPIAVQGQTASAVMTENDSLSADANPLLLLHTTEQVHSGAVSQSGVYQASTLTSNLASASNGGTFDANPFHEKPVAASDIASSSMAPVPDHIGEDIFRYLEDFITLDDLRKPCSP